MNGIIRNFDGYSGFGFIISDDVEEEVFAHIKDFDGNIQKEDVSGGMSVEFELIKTDKGYKATNIILDRGVIQ